MHPMKNLVSKKLTNEQQNDYHTFLLSKELDSWVILTATALSDVSLTRDGFKYTILYTSDKDLTYF